MMISPLSVPLRKGWILAGAAAVAAVAVFAWAFAPRPVEVELGRATRGRFEATVSEDAKTRLRERYVVSAPLAGHLSRIALREGDAVAVDSPVAQLAPALPPMLDERTRRELQARLEATEAQRQRAAARVEGARVALLQAGNEARRSEQLAAQGFLSPTRLEADRLAALAAQKELDAALGERDAAGHEVEQARAALAAVRTPADARRFSVRSPVAGRVMRIVQPSEALVAPGTPLIELGDLQQLEVVAELLTSDALQVREGAAVRIGQGGGDGPLPGRVRRIEPAGFTKVSALGVEEQRVRVLIDMTGPPADRASLGDGYRVSVSILTLVQDGVVKLPVSALFPLADGADASAMAVFVVDGGRARLTRVTVAARNATEAWVSHGVAPGVEVIVYPPPGVADGVRVKPRHV